MKSLNLAATLAAVLGLMVSGAEAQQPGTVQPGRTVQQGQVQQTQAGRQYNNRTAQSHKSMVRASEVIGMEVKNNQDEDLGAIEDLAIDPNTGRIAYAAVSMGGFLGLGDKLFAVPWDAVQYRVAEGSSAADEDAEHVLVLNVNKEQMEDAEGFDQDNWPDMANETWQQDNDRRYRSTQRPTTQPRREF